MFTPSSILRALLIIHSVALGLDLQAAPLNWSQEKGYRWAKLTVPANGVTGFSLLPVPETGITFSNGLSEIDGARNRVLFNGSGLAVGDYDGDGLPDIYFCSLNGQNRLYRNLGGWRFEETTAKSGVVTPFTYYRGAVFADLNGDRLLDLLVSSNGEGVSCFLNQGAGKFVEATEFCGTRSSHGSVSMALADIDGNGTLDLYVASNRKEDIRDQGRVNIEMVKGRPRIPESYKDRLLLRDGLILEYGEPSVLYLNDGQGRMKPVSFTNGQFLGADGLPLTKPPLDWTLSVSFRDVNQDGAPDLYVCNDFWTPDRFWINNGKGVFRAADNFALRKISASSMGVDFADVDRDGRYDFFVVDMLSRDPRLRKRQVPAQAPAASTIGEIDTQPQVMRNTLFHSRGDGTYAELAEYAGVSAADWAWSPVFLDVDLDGYEDLVITSGHVLDVQDQDAEARIRSLQHSWSGYTNAAERQAAFTAEHMEHLKIYPRLDMPVVAYQNKKNLRFEEKTEQWGLGFKAVHHSIALADFDQDGDLDLVVNNLGSAAGVYRNNSSAQRLTVRLIGKKPNTQGVGAQIKVHSGDKPVQMQEVVSGGGYLSGSDPIRVFACSGDGSPMKIEVTWRDGRKSMIPRALPNCIYEIDEEGMSSADPELSVEPAPSPLFELFKGGLKHRHVETAFSDFERQPLLPRKMSQLGPGVAWLDFDGDGWEDLVIGSGRGGRIALLRNFNGGELLPFNNELSSGLITRDQTGLAVYRNSAGENMLIAGSSNYEDGLAKGPSARVYNFTRKQIAENLPANASSTGPVTLGYPGPGLTLFIGGRINPGRYPESASSQVFSNDGMNWVPDVSNQAVFQKLGLVTAAVFSDIDGDAFQELILACEWGSVRVFKMRSGRFEEITKRLGLDRWKGWWNSVTTGDLNGDGRLDIIAGNWGLNHEFAATQEIPLQLYYGDFSGRGIMDVFETEFYPEYQRRGLRRSLNSLSAGIPDLRGRFSSHKTFSETFLEEAVDLSKTSKLEVNTMASMVFWNRGGKFEGIALPDEVQLSPVFGINVSDFNGDGFEDLLCLQNFFPNQPEVPRYDAGRSLLLLGEPGENLRAVSSSDSGVRIYGEGRGLAVCDFDHDGRIDFAAAQNGAQGLLFRNQGAKPGLRVRVEGPKENLDALGALVWLEDEKGTGPVHEIKAGNGYWSQDAKTEVLAMRGAPKNVHVRWPGGKSKVYPVESGAREISVRWSEH